MHDELISKYLCNVCLFINSEGGHIIMTEGQNTQDILLDNGTLFVLKDGELISHMDVKDIFDSDRFNHMKAVTYSASPEFINKYLANFDSLKLVVGIQERHVQQRNGKAMRDISRSLSNLATHAIAKGEVVEFVNSLDSKVIKAYVDNQFQMFVPIISAIHAKIYLLWNDETNETRVVKGSANLSNQAFNQNVPQIEDIDIIDNNEDIFNAYNSWFDDVLLKTTIPYIADNAKKQLAKKVPVNDNPTEDDISDPTAVNIIRLSNDESDKFKENLKLDMKQSLESKHVDGILTDEALEALRNPAFDKASIDQYKHDAQDEVDDDYYGAEVITEMINRRTKVAKFIPDDRFKVKMNKLRKIHVHREKSKLEDDMQFNPYQLVFDRTSRDHGNSGIVMPIKQQSEDDSEGKIVYMPYGHKADIDTIKYGLETIDMLLKNYKDFIFNYDDDYGKEIMELIMYSFTGPFLWEIRQQSDDALDCPQFLFVGGAAGSGKSSLIKIISQMMGYPEKNNLIGYSSIVPDSVATQKKSIVDELRRWTKSDSTIAPILIDEIPEIFFSQQSYGPELLKDVSNKTEESAQPYPMLIGTTNSSNYSLPEEGKRRSYYLSINRQFIAEKRTESRKRLNEVSARLNDDLFKDFVLRMGEYLEQEDEVHFNVSPSGKLDFLTPTREIFKQYYQEVGMELPKYFPETRFDNSLAIGRTMWRNTFEADKQNDGNHIFVAAADGESYLVNKALLDMADGQYQRLKTSSKYANALPQGIEDPDGNTGNYLKLNKQRFLDWVDSTELNAKVDTNTNTNAEPEHKGLWARIFNK